MDFWVLHPKQLGLYLGKGIIDPRIFDRDSTLPTEIEQIAIVPVWDVCQNRPLSLYEHQSSWIDIISWVIWFLPCIVYLICDAIDYKLIVHIPNDRDMHKHGKYCNHPNKWQTDLHHWEGDKALYSGNWNN